MASKSASAENPMRMAPPKEVPLPAAPLVCVLAQIRFQQVLQINQPNDDSVAKFQKEVRNLYPIFEASQHHELSPTGVTQEKLWRFSNDAWQVVLSSTFVSLTTSKYESRDDFCKRLRAVLGALELSVAPTHLERIGVRFIDQVIGDNLADLPALVRSEVLGITSSPCADDAVMAISETLFSTDEGDVRARWGILPKKATLDPVLMPVIDEQSWVLDLDMGTQTRDPFAVDAIVAHVDNFATRLYTVFRWAVTPEFLRRYGGEV